MTIRLQDATRDSIHALLDASVITCDMQSQKSHSRDGGFSLVELLIVLGIIAILLSIAVPMLMSALASASETAVVREVQTIHQAQVQYHSQFGDYASTLAQLGPPENGVPGPQSAKLIPASLSSGEKNGYRFSLTKTPAGFQVNANPRVFGKDGRRTFYIDEDGIVHQNWSSEPATAQSPEVK
jgi:prepilin-type N-terminal cleavage/methylation domain-containing protein